MVVISDPIATRKIVSIAKVENPDIYIIARTRYVLEVETLKNLGADEVIPEEFETSIEIFSKVLDKYRVPINLILNYIEKIRESSYQALRNPTISKKFLDLKEDFLKNIEFEKYYVSENLKIHNLTLKDLNLRAISGASVLAIQRDDQIISNPSADFVIKGKDILIIYGRDEDLKKAVVYLNSI